MSELADSIKLIRKFDKNAECEGTQALNQLVELVAEMHSKWMAMVTHNDIDVSCPSYDAAKTWSSIAILMSEADALLSGLK